MSRLTSVLGGMRRVPRPFALRRRRSRDRIAPSGMSMADLGNEALAGLFARP